jgi:hypothetical protein
MFAEGNVAYHPIAVAFKQSRCLAGMKNINTGDKRWLLLNGDATASVRSSSYFSTTKLMASHSDMP